MKEVPGTGGSRSVAKGYMPAFVFRRACKFSRPWCIGSDLYVELLTSNVGVRLFALTSCLGKLDGALRMQACDPRWAGQPSRQRPGNQPSRRVSPHSPSSFGHTLSWAASWAGFPGVRLRQRLPRICWTTYSGPSQIQHWPHLSEENGYLWKEALQSSSKYSKPLLRHFIHGISIGFYT